MSDDLTVTGFAELTLETTDLPGLERFYCENFAMRVLDRQDDRIWLAVGERARLGLWSPGPKEYEDQGGRHVHFAMSAGRGQLKRISETLRSHAVEVRGPVVHDGGDQSIYLRDPAGNLVEVWDFFERGDGAAAGVDALA
jgi:catechol-2,3-dioxygenase